MSALSISAVLGKLRTWAFFALIVLVHGIGLASASYAQDLGTLLPGSSTGTEEAETSREVDVVSAVPDAEIERRIQGILETTGWFANPEVEVREGVVFLQGEAETTERKRWAARLAESTQGVVAVVDRLTVEADIETTFERANEEWLRLKDQAIQAWPVLVISIVVIIAAWLISKLVSMLARTLLAGRIGSPLLLAVTARAISVPVFLLGIYFVLRLAGLTQLALTVLGGTGLVGIIIGFAFRDIAENFLASLLLSMRNPFNSGDLIEVAGYEGVVRNLNTRSTVLLTLDGNHVQIPNATVFKNTIKNYSSIPSRRAEFMLGIGYDSSVGKSQELVGKVLSDHPAVLDDPEPLVLVDNLGDATVNLKILYWFDSAAYSPAKINSALMRQAKNALLEGGIEMPDPAREVVFPQGVPIVQMDEVPAPKKPAQKKSQPEDDSEATATEGDLSSEASKINRTDDAGAVPEADTNLLKR